MKAFLVGLLLVSAAARGNVIVDNRSPQAIASRAVQAVFQGLNYCGLYRMSPWDPRLPRPLVPATQAIANRTLRLLAYYHENISWYNSAEFKNPNGGFRHHVDYNNQEVIFVTPFAGQVARAVRYNTIGGPAYQFYCRGLPIAPQQFDQCVQWNFVDVITTQQLCKHAEFN